jgi:hypothetical protein
VVNGYFKPELETGIDSEEEFLYDPSLVRSLDFSDSKVKFEPKISPASPGQDLLVRPLGSKDFGRGKTIPVFFFYILLIICSFFRIQKYFKILDHIHSRYKKFREMS